MDFNSLPLEQIVGGLVAILAAIYGVYKNLKTDNVVDAHQRSEINRGIP